MDARAGLGRVGNLGSMYFDGIDDYVNLGQDSSIDLLPDQEYSISVFARYIGSGGYMISKIGSTASSTVQFAIVFFNGIRCLIGGTANDTNQVMVLNKWYHAVLTNKNIGGTYYGELLVDNVSNGLFLHGSAITAGTDVLLGARRVYPPNSGTGFLLNGNVDNCKIYKRALNVNEIKLLSQDLPISRSGLVGEWNLNKIISGVTPDTSGNGNDGTVTGAVITTDKPF